MRLRRRTWAIVLLLFAFIFLFLGLNTERHDSTKKHRRQGGRKIVYFTPNNHIIDAQTSSNPSGLARSHSYERVVYNRVPKCGSRSVISLSKVIAKKNKFQVVEPASNYPYQLMPNDQKRISELVSALNAPFLYHRHMHYIDFTRFGGPSVAYINLIRDPVARAVSHFYFRRHGDRVLNKTRAKQPIKHQDMTYDECVLKERRECVGNWGIFFIVPFFCGHSHDCRNPTRWALEEAKKNVAKYLVVGILEEYDDFIKVLEKLLPNFFQGAYKQSKRSDSSIPPKSVMSETRQKRKPSEKVITLAKKYMKLEYEFYDFVKERFHRQKRSLGIE